MTGYTYGRTVNGMQSTEYMRSRRANVRMSSKMKTRMRSKERMIAKIRLLLISFAVMILCMTILSGFSRPQASDYGMERYYTTVKIGNGDRLWDIAQEYYTAQEGDLRSYIREIEKFNDVRADRLIPGQLLVIPYLVHIQN